MHFISLIAVENAASHAHLQLLMPKSRPIGGASLKYATTMAIDGDDNLDAYATMLAIRMNSGPVEGVCTKVIF